jgi:pimeloyl-ACP methyl ester carboxylesterase
MHDRTVVLVHGAWHGAWCWEQVTPHLDAAGVAWRALDLPMRTLEGDVAEVAALLDAVGAPVVLVGHSYGGAVLTAAGAHPVVEHLVFLCALTPTEGESCAHCHPDSGAPGTELGDAFDIDEAQDVRLRPDAVGLLYNLCSGTDAQAAYRRLRPIALECFTASPAVVAWEKVPSTYVVCEADLGIHPELQHALAARCGGTTVVWDLDHSPFYSDPARTAALLVSTARHEP